MICDQRCLISHNSNSLLPTDLYRLVIILPRAPVQEEEDEKVLHRCLQSNIAIVIKMSYVPLLNPVFTLTLYHDIWSTWMVKKVGSRLPQNLDLKFSCLKKDLNIQINYYSTQFQASLKRATSIWKH